MEELDEGDILTGLREQASEAGQKVYVVLYERVSRDYSALVGHSLTAMMKQMLRRCAKYGFIVVGVGLDVESGGKWSRTGLRGALDAIHETPAAALMVPSLERAHRDERDGVRTLWELEGCESWIYYGASYDDMSLKYTGWGHLDTRDRGERGFREGERLLAWKKGAIRASHVELLEEGQLINRKPDIFSLHRLVEFEDEKGIQRRKFKKKNNGRRLVLSWKKQFSDARENEDYLVFEKLAQTRSLHSGKEIKWDDIIYELGMYLSAGFNCRSPDTFADFNVECPRLAYMSIDEYEEMMDDVNWLYVRRPTYRIRHGMSMTPEGEELLMATREVQLAEQADIVLEPVHYCIKEGVIMDWVGNTDARGDIQQGQFRCRNCHGVKSGAPGKRRVPEWRHVAIAKRMAPHPCFYCGLRNRLYYFESLFVGRLEVPVYVCSKCKRPGATGTPKLPGSLALPPTQDEKNSDSRAMEEQRHFAQIRSGIIEATPPYQSGLRLWNKQQYGAQEGEEDRSVPAMLGRMVPILIEHHKNYFWTGPQLRSIGIGGRVDDRPKDLTPRWSQANGPLRKRLRESGLSLESMKVKHSNHLFIYWVEPLKSS